MNRFKTALLLPEKLIDFEKDRILTVLLYMVLFALLTMVGPLIDGLTFERVPVATQEVILQDLIRPEDCLFENNTFTCETTSMKLYQQTGIAVYLHLDDLSDLSLPAFETTFILQSNKIVTIAAGEVMSEVLYQDLDLPEVLNFGGTQQQQISAFFTLTSAALVHYRALWIPILMGLKFFSSLFMFLIFVLINAALIKPRTEGKTFKESFVLMAYASTGLYLIWILDSIIPLSIFLFLVLLIFAFRRTSRLALILQMPKPLEDDEDL
jgi:hypothetical protein